MNLGLLVTNRTVLIGAGFSKNFGGFLANEVNDLLLVDPNIAANERLKPLVRDDYNYEHALAYARQSPSGLQWYPPEDIKAFEAAITNVYRTQNAILSDHQNNHYQALITTAPTHNFFKMFGSGNWRGDSHSSAYYFSLNQDILLERLLISGNAFHQRPYQLPGVTGKDWFFQGRQPLPEELHSKLLIRDDAAAVDGIEWRNHNNIIKLHGSADWQNQRGNLLVIGGNKQLFIDQSPLLTAYQQVFKAILTKPGMRLMVIGYGFGDSHINDIIAEGIDSGLRIWVWGFGNRQSWSNHMTSGRIVHGAKIREATNGYTDADLREVLRGNSASQREFHPILDAFFRD